MEFDGRHTIVWEKRNGQWLIIHEHVSKPLFWECRTTCYRRWYRQRLGFLL